MLLSTPSLHLSRVRAILAPVMDVIEGRVERAEPPSWCVERNWSPFLLSLSDDALMRCEAEGLACAAPSFPGVPHDMATLAGEVRSATAIDALDAPERELLSEDVRAVRARKRGQLSALLGALEERATRSDRIVDVGAGSGHLTRLASALFDREALGIDRDPARVAAASARAGARARFEVIDASKTPITLAQRDLAVGLHACGALGDKLVIAASEARASLALVSCCLQKIEGPARASLSRAGEGLCFARATLGITNLTSSPQGVEVSLERTLAAREARYALFLLLRRRGAEVSLGDETHGINRRRARAGLAAIAGQALALRGLPPPSEDEITWAETKAHEDHAVMRRLSLPRNMLARLVELAIVLDRAAYLEERGYSVTVASIVPRAVTPRNLALFAEP